MSELAQLNELITRCTDCDLHLGARNAVPGEGPENARIMFVGEAPGWYEDQQGRPFVGPAGRFLDDLLGLAGLRRQDVFIANVIKHRPPNNRDPLPKEVEACHKWLERQIEIIKPEAIVTLGRHSMGWFCPKEAISKVHGTAHLWKDDVAVIHMYHPAAALHQQALRKTIEEDFKKLPSVIAAAKQEAAKRSRPEPQQPDVQQMRLF